MKTLSRIASWLVGMGLLCFLLSKVDVRTLWHSLEQMKLSSIGMMAGFTILANAFQGARFYALWPDGRASLRKQIGLPFCMHTANILLPLRVGEAVQPLMLKKWKPQLNMKKLVGWVVMDKALEAIVFSGFVLAAAFIFGQFQWLVTTIFIVGHIVYFSFLRKLKARPSSVALAYLAAIGCWVANAAFFCVLLQPLKAGLGLFVGTSLASSLPLAPAGLGTYEAAFVWISEHFGVSAPVATAQALSAHSISILATLAIGVPLGAYWGWPKVNEDDASMNTAGTPLRYKISNIFVYLLAALTVISSGALWIPEKRMPRRRAKTS